MLTGTSLLRAIYPPISPQNHNLVASKTCNQIAKRTDLSCFSGSRPVYFMVLEWTVTERKLRVGCQIQLIFIEHLVIMSLLKKKIQPGKFEDLTGFIKGFMN